MIKTTSCDRWFLLAAVAISTTAAAPEQRWDAILFRTHFVDDMVVHKLRELAAQAMDDAASSAAPWDINIIYDADATADFAGALGATGCNLSAVHLFPTTLKTFTKFPAIKPTVMAKSHNQHLAYVSWFAANKDRRPWRYIWCMEHDVAATKGAWRRVLDYHLAPPHRDSDFISWRVGWSLRADKVHGGGQWNIGQRHGKISRGHVADREVSVHFGPLLRFSRKFMALLEAESRLGTTGHSEVAPSTLCNITAWCSMSNLSLAVMGGHEGGLFDYKLPTDISSSIWRALEHLEPGGKLFHPVRDIESASDQTNIGAVHHKNGKSAAAVGTKVDRNAMYMAQCLLRNPRPPRPSYDCPFGCPWHEQHTCPIKNCMARLPGGGTYHHMAYISCYNLCRKTGKCPWLTGTREQEAIAIKQADTKKWPGCAQDEEEAGCLRDQK